MMDPEIKYEVPESRHHHMDKDVEHKMVFGVDKYPTKPLNCTCGLYMVTNLPQKILL